MRLYFGHLLVATVVFLAACEDGGETAKSVADGQIASDAPAGTPDTANTADTADTAGTADTANTADAGDTGGTTDVAATTDAGADAVVLEDGTGSDTAVTQTDGTAGSDAGPPPDTTAPDASAEQDVLTDAVVQADGAGPTDTTSDPADGTAGQDAVASDADGGGIADLDGQGPDSGQDATPGDAAAGDAGASCTPACAVGSTCISGTCVVDAPLALTSIEPASGYTAGGTAVLFVGSGLGKVQQASIGGTEVLQWSAATDGKSATCLTPPHVAGKADVVLFDGTDQAYLLGGFTYIAPPVPAVQTLGPLQLVAAVTDTPVVQAAVQIAGIDSEVGAVAGMQVEVGVQAPADSAPIWYPATFVSDGPTGEVWQATLPLLPALAGGASYSVTARATWQAQVIVGDHDGSGNGSPSAGTVQQLQVLAEADMPPILTGVSAPVVPAMGGGKVTILGKYLKASYTVEFAGKAGGWQPALAVKSVNGGLQATVPGVVVGWVDVRVTAPDKPPAELLGKLYAGPIATAQADGVLSDWDSTSTLVTASVVSDWNGNKNKLYSLAVAYDATHLYLALSGTCESGNAIVVYLNLDDSDLTGAISPGELADSSSPVSDAISSLVQADLAGWDLAAATIGMTSDIGGPAATAKAGWRMLTPVDQLPVVAGIVIGNSPGSVIEAAVPLASLYPMGIPADGVDIKLAAVLVSANGNLVSNQFLPASTKPATIGATGTFRLYQTVP